MSDLSRSKSVDVTALAGLFSNTTNSYKYVFFQALLEKCRNSDFEDRLIRLDDLAIEMIALAWYPYKYFHISFGLQDKIGKVIDNLDFDAQSQRIGSHTNQKRLRGAIKTQADTIKLSPLLRYVPFRLLSPFFRRETQGMSDALRDRTIHRLANEHFHKAKPFYRFCRNGNNDTDLIELHPDWNEYIKRNYSIVKGWAERRWLGFLQKRNPTMPALSEKLYPPNQRAPLNQQRRFWKLALHNAPLFCIYSGRPLNPESFALDHFLPWSYVCHDQLWNLVPTSKGINSSKGHSVPSEEYLNPLADIHSKALAIVMDAPDITRAERHKFIEAYLADLKVQESEITEGKIMGQTYQDVLLPQMNLARQAGFQGGWVFS